MRSTDMDQKGNEHKSETSSSLEHFCIDLVAKHLIKWVHPFLFPMFGHSSYEVLQ